MHLNSKRYHNAVCCIKLPPPWGKKEENELIGQTFKEPILYVFLMHNLIQKTIMIFLFYSYGLSVNSHANENKA